MTEAMANLKAAEADVALLSTFWEAVREHMDAHTAEIAELQEQVATKSAEL